jgi:uncharacterized protein (DUF885 family)
LNGILTNIFLCLLLSLGIPIQGYSQKPHGQSEGLAGIIRAVDSFKGYDKKKYPLGKFEEALYRKGAEFAREQLKLLAGIAADSLRESEWISRDLLQFTLQERVDTFAYQMYLNPIQADQGFHLDLNYQIKPILNYKDARRYLNVLNAIPLFTSEHITLLKKGLEKGLSQPGVIFEGYEATYEEHIVSDFKESRFYEPFRSLPEIISAPQKDSILKAARAAIEQRVVPSFVRIKDFFEGEYVPHTRKTIGISETPGGGAYYQNRINYFTSSDAYSPDDIHHLGLKEVARIRAEMEKIIAGTGFKGNFKEFLHFLRTDQQFYASSGEALLREARNMAKKLDAGLPKYFITLPRKTYGVVQVPDALAPKYTGGRYSAAKAEDQPGYYLVNTYKLDSRPLYVLPSLTAHEAVPGHHLQIALNKELGDSIPAFRKALYLSVYGEGWALYSEFLADEMGLYTTPYEEFGKLTYEMWRACRLVVDTGIHAKGWSRQQAVDYMLEHTALSEHEVNTETDRYIGWPGQAISYKIGELRIRELRRLAETTLGSDFDIRRFHELILEQGTVTLPILEKRVRAYLSELQK